MTSFLRGDIVCTSLTVIMWGYSVQHASYLLACRGAPEGGGAAVFAGLTGLQL